MSYRASYAGVVDRFDDGCFRSRANRGLPMGITSKGREVVRIAYKYEFEGFSPADLKFDSGQVHAVSLLELEGLLMRVKTMTGVRYWITEEGSEIAQKILNGSI